MNKGMKE